LKTYKPIEVWKCESIEAAIEKCEENKDKDCWVYIEILTDRYVREDEIKKMKSTKKDILEIIPKIIGENEEEIDISSFYEKSLKKFLEIFI